MIYKTVIVADGTFPAHEIPLRYIRDAETIVCCDGSTSSLIDFGLEPAAIVGDMDSLSDDLAVRYADRLFKDDSQETNDLTKAVNWCIARGYNDIVILGATGKREDHTLGNISLLLEYAKLSDVIMVTDSGIFIPVLESTTIETVQGQQVSVFSIDPLTEISSTGLKYILDNKRLTNWWTATLNEATGSKLSLEFSGGRVIIYLKFFDPPLMHKTDE